MNRKLASILLLVTLAACAGSPSMPGHNCSSGGEVCVELRAEVPIRWGEPFTVVTTVTSVKNISDLDLHLVADSAEAVVFDTSEEEQGKVMEKKQNWVIWQVDMKEKQSVVFTRKITLPPREGEFRIQAQAYQPGYFAQDMIRIYLTKKGGEVFYSGTPIPITPGPMPFGPTLSPEEVETLRAAPTDTPYVPVVKPSPEITGTAAYPPPNEAPLSPPSQMATQPAYP